MMPWVSYRYGVTGYFIWAIFRPPLSAGLALGCANYLYAGEAGPVDTLRWEMVREGIEDYEYAVLLQEEIDAVRSRPQLASSRHAALRRAAAALAQSRTYADCDRLEVDPTGVMAIRDSMARSIESLTSGAFREGRKEKEKQS